MIFFVFRGHSEIFIFGKLQNLQILCCLACKIKHLIQILQLGNCIFVANLRVQLDTVCIYCTSSLHITVVAALHINSTPSANIVLIKFAFSMHIKLDTLCKHCT